MKITEEKYFEAQLQKIYPSPENQKKMSKKKTYEVVDFMLGFIESADYMVIDDMENDLTIEGRSLIKKLFLIDSVHAEFGVEILKMFFGNGFWTQDAVLKKKIKKIVKSVEK